MTNTEWKESKFKELYLIPSKNGVSKPSRVRGNGFKMINMGELFSHDRIYDIPMELVPLTEAEQISAKVEPFDLLFARQSLVAEGAGKCDIVMEVSPLTVFESHLIRVRLNQELAYPPYFYYYFKSPFSPVKRIIQHCVQAGIKASDLAEVTVKYPPLAEQQRIAKILSSIDDKIELNNAINRNLEEQAQILFKNYEENKPSNLMKIADVAEINPDSFGLKDNWSFVNYLDTSSITQNVISELQYINLNEEKLPSRAKRKVVENDIVYSTVRPNQLHFGFINEVKPNMLVSTGFAVIRSKNPLVSNEYIYLNLTKRETIEKLQQIAEQSVSTFPAIKPSDIGDCLINVFEKEDAEILNNQLSAVFKKISQNNQENQRLALIRDSLLPKLMSGEMELGC